MLSKEEILQKARNYCSYQERCTKQLSDKLGEWAVPDAKKGGIISQMQKEGYLNDERFAIAYAVGKHKTRKWGRIKIKLELRAKGLEGDTIQNAIQSIDDELYLQNLKELLEAKLDKLSKEKNDYIRKNKAAQSAARKGYESDLIWEVLKEKAP